MVGKLSPSPRAPERIEHQAVFLLKDAEYSEERFGKQFGFAEQQIEAVAGLADRAHVVDMEIDTFTECHRARGAREGAGDLPRST
jgi:hypothetical protein